MSTPRIWNYYLYVGVILNTFWSLTGRGFSMVTLVFWMVNSIVNWICWTNPDWSVSFEKLVAATERRGNKKGKKAPELFSSRKTFVRKTSETCLILRLKPPFNNSHFDADDSEKCHARSRVLGWKSIVCFSPCFHGDPSAVAMETITWNNTPRYLWILICLASGPKLVIVL